jgi:hypothetical protein
MDCHAASVAGYAQPRPGDRVGRHGTDRAVKSQILGRTETIDRMSSLDRDAVAVLCRRFGVRRLAIFGSAVTDRFNEERSDVDFLAGCAH